jgi:hypothetical protein
MAHTSLYGLNSSKLVEGTKENLADLLSPQRVCHGTTCFHLLRLSTQDSCGVGLQTDISDRVVSKVQIQDFVEDRWERRGHVAKGGRVGEER